MGKRFEEFCLGEEHWTPGRTVTEADITLFSAIIGDWNPQHADATFAALLHRGDRTAAGAMTAAMCSGLVARLGLVDTTMVRVLDLSFAYERPVFIGTRLQALVRVSGLQPEQAGAGVVTFDVRAVNESDEQVARGRWRVLVSASSSHR